MKKAVVWFVALSICLFSLFSCAAEESFSLTAGKEFAVFGKTEGVEKRLQMSKEETQKYCQENDIVYLAVNADNTKQIRLSISKTDFSESIGHLSGLSDEKIRSLLPELTGETQGEIITKDGEKFIRQEILLDDSGGKYLLTRYITAAAQKYYVLSFYTQSGTETDYTGAVFSAFSSPDFNKETEDGASPILQIVFPVLILIFSLGAGGIVFLLIRDIRRQEPEEEN